MEIGLPHIIQVVRPLDNFTETHGDDWGPTMTLENPIFILIAEFDKLGANYKMVGWTSQHIPMLPGYLYFWQLGFGSSIFWNQNCGDEPEPLPRHFHAVSSSPKNPKGSKRCCIAPNAMDIVLESAPLRSFKHFRLKLLTLRCALRHWFNVAHGRKMRKTILVAS